VRVGDNENMLFMKQKSQQTCQHTRVRNNSESRSRTYSGSIDDLHDRRFKPVAQSMALNIARKCAEKEEKRLEKEGLPAEEVCMLFN